MIRCASVLVPLLIVCAVQAEPVFRFQDAGDASQLMPAASGIRGHGAAWGDVDGDGWPDLFIASFHNQGSKPGMLLRNAKGLFKLDPQPHLATTGMGSGALFVDLNNTGRLDLFVSNCANGKEGVTTTASYLFRNDGDGRFTDISKESGACLPMYAGRGVAAADIDGDGLIDLITCERYYGKVNHGPAILRNLGHHRFENISKQAGLPEGLSGLAVAAVDLNGDHHVDLFFTEGGGEHRLYLNDGKGRFVEHEKAREWFRWSPPSAEDTPAGVCIDDVNGDGLPDVVIGHHYKAPWRQPEPVRLYLHQGVKDGLPSFKEVTKEAGLMPITMKAPHVELQDFDNDGRLDLYVSIVKFKDGTPHPLIYRNTGNDPQGVPQFQEQAWAVNDFPNAEDLAVKRTGDFFAKILKDRKVMYVAAGPTCDYDRDGRIDLFMANWWIEDRSLLLKNETPGGHWLQVTVEGGKGVNRMGVGSVVTLLDSATGRKLAQRPMQLGSGYCSGQEAMLHFGLGDVNEVDVSVLMPHGQEVVEMKKVKSNQRITVRAR